jgi:predicted transcriptional regulator of viral defense system
MFHGLTLAFPQPTFATIAAPGADAILPIGTTPGDWEGIALPASLTPETISGRRAVWTVVPTEQFFGFEEHRPYGYPVRVTTVERTLLDAMQSPELCGGIDNVLRAWAFARDGLNLDSLVHLIDRFDLPELRQRTGFILEEMGLTHPAIDAWLASSPRGESGRLDANEPYSAEINPRWNLSVNAPLGALRDEAA